MQDRGDVVVEVSGGDAREELLVFSSGWSGVVYVQATEGWRRGGSFSTPGAKGRFDAAELERAQVVAPKWQDLEVQGQRLQVQVGP